MSTTQKDEIIQKIIEQMQELQKELLKQKTGSGRGELLPTHSDLKSRLQFRQDFANELRYLEQVPPISFKTFSDLDDLTINFNSIVSKFDQPFARNLTEQLFNDIDVIAQDQEFTRILEDLPYLMGTTEEVDKGNGTRVIDWIVVGAVFYLGYLIGDAVGYAAGSSDDDKKRRISSFSLTNSSAAFAKIDLILASEIFKRAAALPEYKEVYRLYTPAIAKKFKDEPPLQKDFEKTILSFTPQRVIPLVLVGAFLLGLAAGAIKGCAQGENDSKE